MSHFIHLRVKGPIKPRRPDEKPSDPYVPGAVTIAVEQSKLEQGWSTLLGVSYWSANGKTFSRREARSVAQSRLKSCPLRMVLDREGNHDIVAAFKEFVISGPHQWREVGPPLNLKFDHTIGTDMSVTLTGIMGLVRVDARYQISRDVLLMTMSAEDLVRALEEEAENPQKGELSPPRWVESPPRWAREFLENV